MRQVFLSLILLPLLLGVAFGQEFGGIGAAVVPISTGELVVIKVLENSPAADAGLLPGDLIVQVDGRPLRGTRFSEIVSKHLWGRPGSRVELVFLRPGRRGEQKADLLRVPMNPAPGQTPGVEMVLPPDEGPEKLEEK